MARDSQAALVALNRFGFGARGGASGDFVNAASDPRGFVKAELSRPNGVLLEMPGLLSTPALGEAVFAYQAEVKQAREATAKSGIVALRAAGPVEALEGADLFARYPQFDENRRRDFDRFTTRLTHHTRQSLRHDEVKRGCDQKRLDTHIEQTVDR